MVLSFLAGVVLLALGAYATVKVASHVMTRVGLDLMSALLWLGLAEWPLEQPRAQRQRLKHLLVESPSSLPG